MKTQPKWPIKTTSLGPTSSSQSTPVKKVSIKKIFAFIALAIIVAVAGLLTYRHEEQRKTDEKAFQADKAQFAQVEKDMDAAYAAMTANDKPLKEEKTKSCSNDSVKFEKGPLSCRIRYVVVYGANDYEHVLDKQAALLLGMQQYGFRPVGQDLAVLNKEITSSFSDERGFRVDLEKYDSIDCTASFSVYKPTELKYEYVKQPRAGSYSFSCLEYMKTPIYSLEEY